MVSRDTELGKSFDEVTCLTAESKKSVDGHQATADSLATRDSYLAKVSKLSDSTILKLATECFKSSKSSKSVAGVTAYMGRFLQQLYQLE